MLNLLIYEQPETVNVSGMDLPIFTDFRDYIELSEYLENGTDEEIFFYILNLYKDLPPGLDSGELVTKILEFYKIDTDVKTDGKGGSADPVFSFNDDFAYILGAFRQYYNIDLIRVDYLHWYEFNALLEALPEDSELKKRVGYRSLDATKIKDKNERARIRKIQNKLRIRKKNHRYLSDNEIGSIFG